ncbi:hypothetical protein ACW9IB_08355 [Pseudomonas sp. SDO524_S393]
MQGIQSQPITQSPLTLSGAPEALRMHPGAGMPEQTEIRFTVKIEDYRGAMNLFNDLARLKNIVVKQEFDDFEAGDYGGGFGLYNTVHFSFKPNNADGTFSPALQMRISDFNREFQERLHNAGIRNYAPEA